MINKAIVCHTFDNIDFRLFLFPLSTITNIGDLWIRVPPTVKDSLTSKLGEKIALNKFLRNAEILTYGSKGATWRSE